MQEQGNAGFKIIIAVILAVVSGLLATTVLTDSRHFMLVGIIVLLVTLWTNEGLSLGVVSLLPLMLFPSFDVLSLKSTSSYYANPVIFRPVHGRTRGAGVRRRLASAPGLLKSVLLSSWPSSSAYPRHDFVQGLAPLFRDRGRALH